MPVWNFRNKILGSHVLTSAAGIELAIAGVVLGALSLAVSSWAYYRTEYSLRSKVRLKHDKNTPTFRLDINNRRIVISDLRGDLTLAKGTEPVAVRGIHFASPPSVMCSPKTLGSLFVFPEKETYPLSAVVSTGIIIIGSSPTVPSSLPITDGESINFIGPEVHIPFSEEINSTLDGLLVARDPKRLIDFRQHLMNAMSLIERTYRIAIEADVGSRKTKMYYWIGKKKPGIIKTTVTAGWITARQARRLSREFRR